MQQQCGGIPSWSPAGNPLPGVGLHLNMNEIEIKNNSGSAVGVKLSCRGKGCLKFDRGKRVAKYLKVARGEEFNFY